MLIGHGAIILPSVRSIGHGAVIGAGSVVHADVVPYAVMVGHPARKVRSRFSQETINEIIASAWWDKSPDELRDSIDEFRIPLDGSDEVR